MKIFSRTLSISWILAYLAACGATVPVSLPSTTQSHKEVTVATEGEIEAPSTTVLFSTKNRTENSPSTEDAVSGLNCGKIHMEVDPFARQLARYKHLGGQEGDQQEFSFSYRSCRF